jgi:hypothetical protein
VKHARTLAGDDKVYLRQRCAMAGLAGDDNLFLPLR